MENKDYINEIGKKLEKALDSESLNKTENQSNIPSEETFAKWIQMGEERRKKRASRRKALAACAVFLFICLGAYVAVNYVTPPVVEAGPENKASIDSSMETTATYKTWDELPDEIKDTFIEIKDLPDGYEVEEIEVAEGKNAAKISLLINNGKYKIEIRECYNKDGGIQAALVAEDNNKVLWDGTEVYIQKEKDKTGVKTYKCIVGQINIDLVVPVAVEEGVAKSIVKTVQ